MGPRLYRGRLAEILGNSSISTLLPINSVMMAKAVAAIMISAFVT